MPILAKNKRAHFDYEFIDKYEAGLVLFGYEVKAAKEGQVNLSGSYVAWRQASKGPELFLLNTRISPYRLAGPLTDYDPLRPRKLLITKAEISSLIGKTRESGLTLIPVKMYTKKSLIKLEFALAKGKKAFDKRESIKRRELDRQVRTLTKRRLK